MISVTQARDGVAARLRRNLAAWATAAEDTATTTVALKPPSEKEMLADERSAEAWAREWASLPEAPGLTVDREPRVWRSIGRQVVPIRLTLASARATADFVGGTVARDFARLVRLTDDAVASLVKQPRHENAVREAVRLRARTLLGLDDADLRRLFDVVAWLASNDVGGLRPRQLPVRGVDSKWFESRRGLVTDLHAAVTDGSDLGIVDADALLRVRVLDPTLTRGPITDLAASVEQLEALDVKPRHVLLVENRETLLALPAWDGVVAIHSPGYAVALLDPLAWVWRSEIVYWGDLDSHGFAILHRLRSHYPEVTTTLMDTHTLDAHMDLTVPEPRPSRIEMPTLTVDEARALARLRDGDLRLEQERIPWEYAMSELTRLLGPPSGVA